MISLIAFETAETGTAYCSADAIRSIYTDSEGNLRLDMGSSGGDFVIVPQTFSIAHIPKSWSDTIAVVDLHGLVESLNKIMPSAVDCAE